MSDHADDPHAARRTRRAHGRARVRRGRSTRPPAPPGSLAPPGPRAPGGGLRPAGHPEGRIPAVPGTRTHCRVVPPGPAAPGTAPRRVRGRARVRPVRGRPAAVRARGDLRAPHAGRPAHPAGGAARRSVPGRARGGGRLRAATTGDRAPRPRVPAADGAVPALAARPPARCAGAAVTARAVAVGPERHRAAGAFGLVTAGAEPLRGAPAAPPPGSPPPYARDRTGHVAQTRGCSYGRGGRPPVAPGAVGPVARTAVGDVPYGVGRRPSRRPQAGISGARGAITAEPDRAPPRRPTAPLRTPSHGLSPHRGTRRPPR